MNQNRNNQLSRAAMEQKYLMARRNLLLMLILTAVNIVLFIVGSNTMMLFSATVPYYAMIFGVFYGNTTFLMVCACVTLAIMITYLLSWIFSKDHYAWMIVALVLFVLDTLAMIGLYVLLQDFSGILDVVIHIAVLYYLIIGVRYGYQLKKMPEEVLTYTEVEQENNNFQDGTEDVMESSILRMADTTVKSRVLVETNAAGHHICYRRVKRINELVIDGYVYDDVEMLIEAAHALNARIDGHAIQAGFDGVAHSYIRVDGVQVAKKLRLY